MKEFKCINTTYPSTKENIKINSSNECIESFDNTSIKGTISKKELSTFQEKVENVILTFKDSVLNENQFCLANYINELSQQNVWSSFLKIAPFTLTEFELTKLVSGIFLSDINVFNKEIKNLLVECTKRYPDTELSDIASGYLVLYASEYKNIK